ncbi:hypothetical protein FQZ97_1277130 [compost metagenome]
MAEVREITIKLDQQGQVIPGCWVTDNGYTISQVDRPGHQYAATRPTQDLPFAYSPVLEEILQVIEADIEASEVPA